MTLIMRLRKPYKEQIKINYEAQFLIKPTGPSVGW
jgi:hypothetical protein